MFLKNYYLLINELKELKNEYICFRNLILTGPYYYFTIK